MEIEVIEQVEGSEYEGNLKIHWLINKIKIPNELIQKGYITKNLEKIIEDSFYGLGTVGIPPKGISEITVKIMAEERDTKSTIQGEKLAIEILKSAIHKKQYKEPTFKNLIAVYEKIEENQIFGTKEVVEILKCAPSTARKLMQKFKELDVVIKVKGNGKGKYRFRNKNENKIYRR